MTPQFDVSHDTYDWLTQSLFIGRGRLAMLSKLPTPVLDAARRRVFGLPAPGSLAS